MNRTAHLITAGTLAVVAGLSTAAAAGAAPRTATETYALACDDGSRIVAHVDTRGLPMRSAWVDERGIVAKAFSRSEDGIVTLADGTVAPFAFAEGPSVDTGRTGRSHVVSAAALSNTTACRQQGQEDFTFTLSAEDVALIQIDPGYIGTEARVTGTFALTVFIAAGQLAARS
jgi:hypothetical protein